MISRREILGALLGGAAVTWPRVAVAQPADRIRRIGVLLRIAERDAAAQAQIAAFRQALEELGWTDGRNIRIDYRFAGGDPERIRAYAAELVGAAPDAILAGGTLPLVALQQKTRTVPIVFVQVADPVGQGFVASLARPAGNVTGLSSFEFTMGGKWLEMIKEIAPRVARVAVIFNPETAPYAPYFLRSLEAAAPSLAVELSTAPVRDAAELEVVITALGRAPGGALIVLPDAFTDVHRAAIIALAARYRLPAIYSRRIFAESGGLMSYGDFLVEQYRRAAAYVDLILKGAKPGELPVQASSEFEMVINLKTAKALGLMVPASLLARADEVIE